MESFSKTLTIALAGIFAVLFIVSTVFAFALYNVERSIFDTQLYIQALEEEDVYQRLPDLAAQSMTLAVQNAESTDLLTIFRDFPESQWETLVAELLPPAELKILANDAITQIMAYLNGESENAILSLVSLKTHLSSPQGVDAIYSFLQAQPDCTAEQLLAMAVGEQAIVLCNPPESILFIDLKPLIETEIQAAVSLIPDQVTVIAPDSNRAQKLESLQVLRLTMRLSPVLPMLFLLLVTIVAVRSLNGWLNWWGYPFLIAGLVSMTLTALSKPLAAFMFQTFIAPVLPNALLPDIVDVFKDLVASIVYNAIRPTLTTGGIMALVGMIMIVSTLLLRKRLQGYQAGIR